MYHEFIHTLIAKEMTAFIKAIIKIPALDLKRDQFHFYEQNNDYDIKYWYLVRSNTFTKLEQKLDKHEITYFKWEGELWIGLTTDVKNNHKMHNLYDSLVY